MIDTEDRKIRIRELARAIEASFSIECVSCGKDTDVIATTEWAAAMEFESAGWRMVGNEARCPQCVDKGIEVKC